MLTGMLDVPQESGRGPAPDVAEPADHAFLATDDPSFTRFLRNNAGALLPWHRYPSMPEPPPGVRHGTTVLALVYPGGVIMAGDRRATTGNLIAQNDLEKVHPADDYSAVAFAGVVGMALELVRLFQVELEHYEKIEGVPLSLEGKANSLGSMIRANFGLAQQGLGMLPLFAGYDRDRDTGRIFGMDITGGTNEEYDYAAIGSGSYFARAALKKLYRPDLTEAQALRACVEALYDAADEDTATGGPDMVRGIYPVLATVTADGYRRCGQDEAEAVARVVVDGRMANPGGPRALLPE